METILITGAGPNGVTGKRIKERLEGSYTILNPSSKELNLIDSAAVDEFFSTHNIDYIVHSAVTAPSRGHDNSEESQEIEDNLRMYFNLAKHSTEFKKMFYFGSGAEFDKSLPIINFKESESQTRLPKDKYGFIKYILNQHCKGSENIYNLRLFGTINPKERYQKNVISNLCAKAVCGLPLELKKNCIFSFIDIDDVARFIDYGIRNSLCFHTYNMTSGRYQLNDIAETINRLFCDGKNIVSFSMEGMNKEYSACNERLLKEYSDFTPLTKSLEKVYLNIKNSTEPIDVESIDSRWEIDKMNILGTN